MDRQFAILLRLFVGCDLKLDAVEDPRVALIFSRPLEMFGFQPIVPLPPSGRLFAQCLGIQPPSVA
jgi:hypothetical protein